MYAMIARPGWTIAIKFAHVPISGMAGDPEPSHTLRALAERVADGVHVSDHITAKPIPK